MSSAQCVNPLTVCPPVQFCRAVRSYWCRRRYQRLEAGKRKKVKVAKLGGSQKASGGSALRRPVRLRRVFGIWSKVQSPVGFLTRLRDAYVNSMLGLAEKGPGLSGAMGAEALINRRIPKAHPIKLEHGDFERRLILEICRSIRASGEIVVY